ncbi:MULTISPECIES: hypothetical protein [Paraburkholderia]|uniref:Uncharacterized protein n=1 Tax=Paraburkholderia podalyriae TaxID=1938811 RepID=A0ABR7PLA4_9BURK|nr:hypothetical protein [Paraburkholderia podalyriae]MBC8747162.1 hypothetical protein [Paraburkholderia podalyriae]
MTSLFPGSHLDVRERRYGHFFWQSVRKSIYLHIQSPRMFDADRWFHFALHAGAPRARSDDLAQGMEEARAAWLRHALSMLLSLQSYELRDVLGRSDNRFEMRRMDDHEVATALYNEVQSGALLFVPEREDMRKCVHAIREQREKGAKPAHACTQQPADADMAKLLYSNSSRVPQVLANAKPFEYIPDPVSGVVDVLAGGEGMPGNNQAQNRQTRDVATALGLNKNQAQQLHREIGGRGLGYHEIMERAKDMFNLW